MPATQEISLHLPEGTVLHGSDYEYVIERVLGQGSFGITYLASVKLKGALGELSTKTFVAIKEFCMQGMHSRDGSTLLFGSQYELAASYLDKFRREAVNLSRLRHGNIVRVMESIEENATAYYVMEYVDGPSLGEFVDGRVRLSEAECAAIVRPIAAALSYMHSQSMLHLDVKPSNIMLRRDGTPVLIDFGLSKTFDTDGTIDTKTMVGNGTLGYAPIEQSDYSGAAAGGKLPVTMDVYALGATMYKMLTGERPPEASSVLNEGLPDDGLALCGRLADVVEKAMNPIIKKRYQSVDALVAALPHYDETQINPDSSESDATIRRDSDFSPAVGRCGNNAPGIADGKFCWRMLEIRYSKQSKSRIGVLFSDFGKTLSIGKKEYRIKGTLIPEDVRQYLGLHPNILSEKETLSPDDPRLAEASELIEITVAPDDDVPFGAYRSFAYCPALNLATLSPAHVSAFADARRLLALPSVVRYFEACVNQESEVSHLPVAESTFRVVINYQLDLQRTRTPLDPSITTHNIMIGFDAIQIKGYGDIDGRHYITYEQHRKFLSDLASLEIETLPYDVPQLKLVTDSWISITTYKSDGSCIDRYRLEQSECFDVTGGSRKAFNGGNMRGDVRSLVEKIEQIVPCRLTPVPAAPTTTPGNPVPKQEMKSASKLELPPNPRITGVNKTRARSKTDSVIAIIALLVLLLTFLIPTFF